MEYHAKSCPFVFIYILGVLASLNHGQEPTCTGGEFAEKTFIFTSDTDNFVRHMLTYDNLITQFTLCMRIKTNSLSTLGTVVHYSTPMHLNSIIFAVGKIQQGTGAYIEIAEKLQIVKLLSLELDQWQHVCVAWESLGTSGVLSVFLNHVNVHTTNIAIPGVVIGGSGPLFLGEQIDMFYQFDPYKSFSGEISYLNIWSRVLGDDEIAHMAEDCGSGCGDVLSWTDFTTSDLYNVNTQDIYCDVVPSTELPDMASSSPIVNDNVSAKETLYITSNNTHGSIAASSSKTYSISTSTASPDITEPTTNSSYIQKTSPVDMTTVGYSDPSKSKTDIEETSSSASPGALTTARPDMQQTSLNMGVILSSTVRYGEPEFSSSVKVIASTTGRPDTISSMGTTTSTTVGPDISDANTGGIIASTTNRPDISSEVSSRSMNTPAMVQPNISDTISTKQLYISHAISSVDITKIGFTASSTRSQGIREASSSESIFPSTSRRSDILEISSSEGFAASTSGIPDTSSNKPDIPDANVNITALAPESPDTPEISSSEGIITLTSRSPDMPDTSSKQGIVVSTSARPVVPEIGIASTSKWQDISDTSSNKGSIALTSERPDVPEITSSVGIITSTSSPDVQVISSSVVTPASATARPDIPQEGLSTRISPSTTITSKFTETSTGIEHGESSLSASYIPAEISRTIPRTLTASTYSKTLTSIPPEYKSRSQSYTTVRRSTEEVSTENKVIQPKQTSATPGSCDDAEYSQTSFVFRPITDTGSYVRHYLLQGREFTQFTLCLWIKLNSLSELRTLVRYETVMHTNEIVINVGTISQITGVSLIISDNIEILREVPLQLNKWQHVCIEWDSLGSSGVLKIFLNYATVYTMSIPVADVVIPGTGFFTLGDIEHSFVGEIAFLNMWSRVLTGNEIRDLAKDGANGCGDIISWSDFKDSIFFNVDFGEFKDIASDLPTTLGRVETSVPSIGVEYTSAVMPTSKTVLLETIINSRQTGESSSLLNTEQTAVTTQPVNSGSPFSTVTTSQTTVPSSSKVSTERVPIGHLQTSVSSMVDEYSSPLTTRSKTIILETIGNTRTRPTDEPSPGQNTKQTATKSQNQGKTSQYSTVTADKAYVPLTSKASGKSAPVGQKQEKGTFVGLLILCVIVTVLLIVAAANVTYYAYLEWKKRNRRGHYVVN